MNRILLSVMSVGLTGVMLGAATLAVFTASASSANNMFAAGTLNLTTDGGAGMFNVSNMSIGSTESRTLNVTNTGSLPLTYSGSVSQQSGNVSLYNALHLAVNGTGNLTYDGPLSGFSYGPRSLGVSSIDTLNFTVSLPSTGNNTTDNALQGLNATVNFTLNATQ